METNTTVLLDGNSLSIKDIIEVSRKNKHVELAPNARDKVQKSRDWVENSVKEGKVMYGITTGFGAFKDIVIDESQTAELQLNLIRSHASGVGEAFNEDIVRAMMLLRANSLVKGYSGVRVILIEKILELLNKGVCPYVPSQGSVGSSGDLAPLCHMVLVIIGEGECVVEGKRVPTSEVFAQKNIEAITLSSKEGLGLSNGTNTQTAVLALSVYDAGILIESADVIAALSVEVMQGTKKAFHKNVSMVRNQLGQIKTAANIWDILESSELADSSDKVRVQDSYSLRCIPQVHGAIRDTHAHVFGIVNREINAATDNPLIFPEEDIFLSGGNFHGEPIAIAADILKIAMCELGNISERRTAKMIDPAYSEGLPAFLVDPKLGGLHSGLMIPQYAAAALVSENKVLAHPASVDSIPTSANQEDHVSMGTIAARQVYQIISNVRNVLAIEILNNTQAYEFRKDKKLADKTTILYREIRNLVPPIVGDRVFYKNIEDITSYIKSENILNLK